MKSPYEINSFFIRGFYVQLMWTSSICEIVMKQVWLRPSRFIEEFILSRNLNAEFKYSKFSMTSPPWWWCYVSPFFLGFGMICQISSCLLECEIRDLGKSLGFQTRLESQKFLKSYRHCSNLDIIIIVCKNSAKLIFHV